MFGNRTSILYRFLDTVRRYCGAAEKRIKPKSGESKALQQIEGRLGRGARITYIAILLLIVLIPL